MDDDFIIKRKLAIDYNNSDGISENKRVKTFIKQLTKWAFTKDFPEDSDINYNNLLAQLGVFEANRKKFDLTVKSNLKEKKQLTQLEEHLKDRINKGKIDIQKQTAIFDKSRTFHKNHGDLKLISQNLNQYPNICELKENINELNEELIKLQKEQELLSEKINLNMKQSQIIILSTSSIDANNN